MYEYFSLHRRVSNGFVSFAAVGVPQKTIRRCCVLSAGKEVQVKDQQQKLFPAECPTIFAVDVSDGFEFLNRRKILT